MIECSDPWVRHRVAGATPAKRKGASLVALGNELVLYGGDKSGVSVCAMGGGDWKWSVPAVSGDAPKDRSAHVAVAAGGDMVVFGGASLENGSELADLYSLRKQPGGGWAWSCPKDHQAYVRWAAVCVRRMPHLQACCPSCRRPWQHCLLSHEPAANAHTSNCQCYGLLMLV